MSGLFLLPAALKSSSDIGQLLQNLHAHLAVPQLEHVVMLNHRLLLQY